MKGEPMDRLDELAGPHEQWCHGYAHGDCCGASDCDCGRDERRVAIAAALDEEREKARAPFLALAQELATVATDHHATVAGDAYADAADRIIAVLEGTYL